LVYPFTQEARTARQPQLRKKKVGKSVYWFTKAGGDTYFGNVKDVAPAEAKRLFHQHIVSLVGRAGPGKRQAMTAGEMMDLFLDWVQAHHSDRSYLRSGSTRPRIAAKPDRPG
jgi:hypothetical protein